MLLKVEVSKQSLKDSFHAIFPMIFLFFIPHSWFLISLNMLSMLLKVYVYVYVKKEEPSTVGIFGILFQAIIIAGYIEAL